MRFAQLNDAGEVVGHGSAEKEHFDSALERGEHLVALPDDAPYMLEEIAAYLVSNPQARIGE